LQMQSQFEFFFLFHFFFFFEWFEFCPFWKSERLNLSRFCHFIVLVFVSACCFEMKMRINSFVHTLLPHFEDSIWCEWCSTKLFSHSRIWKIKKKNIICLQKKLFSKTDVQIMWSKFIFLQHPDEQNVDML
jgi:hypothetical protein